MSDNQNRRHSMFPSSSIPPQPHINPLFSTSSSSSRVHINPNFTNSYSTSNPVCSIGSVNPSKVLLNPKVQF